MHSDEKEFLKEQAIKSFDKHKQDDNPNLMPTSKLRFALRGIGYEPKKEQVKQLIDEFDKDQTGSIKKDDFLKIALRRSGDKDNNEILKAFEMFDSKKQGKISFVDLKRVADELGENITDEELHEMIREADKNNDNFVDKDEFLQIMKKTALY